MSDLIQAALRRGNDCPELTQLFEALEAAPQTSARIQAEQHLSGCPSCQTEWSLYRQFEAGEVRPDERPAVDYIVQQVQSKRAAQKHEHRATDRLSFWERFLTPAWLGGAALAVAALIVAIGLSSQWRLRNTSPEVYTENQTLRSQSIEFTTPLSEITQPPNEIQWTILPGAVQYTISIAEVDQTRVVYKKVTSNSLVLPENARNLLLSARTLLLSVTASDAAGREIGRSQITKLRINPR